MRERALRGGLRLGGGPGGEMIDVVVVSVLHDSAPLVPGLLASLEAGLAGAGSWHLVVADSGSEDDGLAVVVSEFPEATTISLGANRGYGAGIDAAVRSAPAHRLVLVMNPDVRLRPGCGAALARRALDGRRSEPNGARVGIVAPLLLHPDGRVAPSIRRMPTVGRVAGEALLGGHRAGRWASLGEVVTDPCAYRHPHRIDWATGALWAVTSECFDAVGGFDPSYFLYSEETDFALRARDAGYVACFEPAAVAVHVGGASNSDPSLYALMTWNRYRCYRRRHGRGASLAFWSALLAGELARSIRGRRTSRAAVGALVRGGPGPVVAATPGQSTVAATADCVGRVTSEGDQAHRATRDAPEMQTSRRAGSR